MPDRVKVFTTWIHASQIFWTLFKNVHCQVPCSLRPCISRPCCRFFVILTIHITHVFVLFVQTLLPKTHRDIDDFVMFGRKKIWSRIYLSLYESLTFWISLRLFVGSWFTMIFFFLFGKSEPIMISSYKCSILLGLDKAKQRFSRLEIETVSNQSEVLKWVPLLRSRCETYSNQRGSPDQNGVKDFLKLNLNSYF